MMVLSANDKKGRTEYEKRGFMKHKVILRRLFAAFAAVTVCLAQASDGRLTGTQSANAANTVSISPYATSLVNDGVFEGWGTSLCWWANRVGYSDSLAKQCGELFFGDSGLRMNIARFNIGGGDNPSHTHITRTDSNMPGYTVYNNGQVTYDWNADANQRNVLMKAIDACSEDLLVEMFSNSPPYYMCKSGCSTGNTDAGKNNLKDDCYDDFAAYMAEVCKHYKEDWGVTINSVEPMNEPYTNYWGANSNKQEGCHFDIGGSESSIILELQKAMAQRGMGDIIICGTDETGIDVQIDAFKALSSDAKNALSRIDTHTYGGSKRTELYQLAVSSGKNLWMSEVDGSGTAGTNAGEMAPALWLAQRMIDDCNGLRCSAWILWQAIDNHISSVGYNGNKDKGMVNTNSGFWGLAVADHDSDKIILTKKYYAYGQLSRYIRPGSKLLASSGSSLAAYDKDKKQLVITAINTSANNADTTFDLSQFAGVGSSVQQIRTSNSENWAELSPLSTNGKQFSASLKGNSITTFIIDDVTAKDLPVNEIKLNANMVTGSDAWNGTSNVANKVVDGDLTSFFDGVGDGWVQIDMGDTYAVDAIAYAPRSGYEYRCADGIFYVSSDGSNWTKVHQIGGVPASGLNYITALPDDLQCRYIRYAVPSGAPQNSANKDSVYCCNIAEIKVYGGVPSEPWGDVNLDGKTTTADAFLLRDALIGKETLNKAQGAQADVSADGKLTAADLTILKAYLLK